MTLGMENPVCFGTNLESKVFKIFSYMKCVILSYTCRVVKIIKIIIKYNITALNHLDIWLLDKNQDIAL